MSSKIECKAYNASFRKTIVANAFEVVRTWYYSIPLILVLIGSYGYFLAHYAISEDDLIYYLYPNGSEISIGRPVWTVLSRVFHMQSGGPWFDDFAGVALLFVVATFICALIRYFSDKHISIAACSVFACLLVSYPMFSDMFCYPCATFRNSAIMLVAALAFCCLFVSSQTGSKGQYALGVLCLFLINGWYEIGVVTFAILSMMFLYLRFIYEMQRKWKFGAFFKEALLYYAVPLFIGVAAMELFVSAYMAIFNITHLDTAGNEIMWGTAGVGSVLRTLAKNIIFLYFIKALFYLPVTTFVVALAICIVSSIVRSAKTHSAIPVFLCIVTMLCFVILSLVQGKVTYYRTLSQPFSLFCAFIALMIAVRLDRKQVRAGVRNTAMACLFLLAYWQASDISHWFSIEAQRSDEETTVITQTGKSIYDDFDSTKPVVCVGSFTDSNYLRDQEYVKPDDWRLNLIPGWQNIKGFSSDGRYACKIQQSNMVSVITWSTERSMKSKPGTALCNYFSLCGYAIKPGSKDQYEDAKSKIESGSIPEFPKKGYIVDEGDYILVNF